MAEGHLRPEMAAGLPYARVTDAAGHVSDRDRQGRGYRGQRRRLRNEKHGEERQVPALQASEVIGNSVGKTGKQGKQDSWHQGGLGPSFKRSGRQTSGAKRIIRPFIDS